MNKFRDKIGGIISLIIFLALVIITAAFNKYLLNTSFKNFKIDGPTARLSKVIITQTSETGDLQSQLSAESVTYDTQDKAIIINPVLQLFENKSDTITASSDLAFLNSKGDVINLSRNVKIKSGANNSKSGFKITAEDTTFNLKSKTAFSDGPVKIKNYNYFMQGVGMKINQTDRSINILKNVTFIRN